MALKISQIRRLLYCTKVLVLVITLLLFATTTGCYAGEHETALEAGAEAYTKGENYRAYMLLRQALLRSPNDGLCRYYIANTLVNLGRVDRALEQYRLALVLSRDQTIRNYCRAALISASAPDGVAAPPAASSGAARVIGKRENQPVSAQTALQRRAATDLIASQIANELALNTRYESQTTERIAYTRECASRLERDAERMALIYRTFDTYGSSLGAEAAGYVAAEKHLANSLRSLATEWQAAQSNVDNMRSSATQVTASGLQSQLESAATRGNRKFGLQQNGTNLFVRNYAAQPEKPIVPLVAVPNSLQVPEQKKAKAGHLPKVAGDLTRRRRVRALLLDPKHTMAVDDIPTP